MPAADILDRLFDVIQDRARSRPEDSYVVQLLDGGVAAIAAKLREETEEVIEAAAERDVDLLAREIADLLFHVEVLMAEVGTTPSAVWSELASRFGVGGLEEKRGRGDDVDAG